MGEKYKKGNIVTIREDYYDYDSFYGENTEYGIPRELQVLPSMFDKIGKPLEIRNIHQTYSNLYRLVGNSLSWYHENWLEEYIKPFKMELEWELFYV